MTPCSHGAAVGGGSGSIQWCSGAHFPSHHSGSDSSWLSALHHCSLDADSASPKYVKDEDSGVVLFNISSVIPALCAGGGSPLLFNWGYQGCLSQEGSIRLVGLEFPPFPSLVLWHKIMALFVTQCCSSSFLFDPEETVRGRSTLRAACALVSTEMLSGIPGSWFFHALAGDESASERFVLLQRCCAQ